MGSIMLDQAVRSQVVVSTFMKNLKCRKDVKVPDSRNPICVINIQFNRERMNANCKKTKEQKRERVNAKLARDSRR
jgi:hypothetical protein